MNRDEGNALMALKNAWTSVIAASDRVRELAPAVQGLPDTTPLSGLDLDTYHQAAFAQANAVMALRGLIEELKRKSATSS